MSSSSHPNQPRNGMQVSLRGQPRNIPRPPPSPKSTTNQPSEPCDGMCAKLIDKWSLPTAFPLLFLNPTDPITSRSPRADISAVSEYFTISHERLGDVRELPEFNADRVPQLPYEICCVCEICQQHRQSIKDSDRGINTPKLVSPGRPPSMAPIFRHPKRPITFLTCYCYWCTSHIEAIDQLAEKVALGASEEADHWQGVSWIDIVVSDWQDILGKKKQAYWSFKALGDLARRPSIIPLGLEKILRVIEALEAVTFLPVGLTRQVDGEPLPFDQVLTLVFTKCMLAINAEASQAFRREAKAVKEEKCHELLLLVDTCIVYAHSYAVASRSANIAIVSDLNTRLRECIPDEYLIKHTFTGIRFDETNQAWLETRPVILPRSVPLNYSRDDADL